MAHLQGGCLCGKVRYSADAQPVFSGVCHCTDCQKFTGSAFSVVVGIPADALTVTGATTIFTKNGDSGKPIHRRFCASCGSSVLDEADAMPGVVMLNAGTLDDRSQLKPATEIFCDSAQPWVHLGADLQRFPRMPR